MFNETIRSLLPCRSRGPSRLKDRKYALLCRVCFMYILPGNITAGSGAGDDSENLFYFAGSLDLGLLHRTTVRMGISVFWYLRPWPSGQAELRRGDYLRLSSEICISRMLYFFRREVHLSNNCDRKRKNLVCSSEKLNTISVDCKPASDADEGNSRKMGNMPSRTSGLV